MFFPSLRGLFADRQALRDRAHENRLRQWLESRGPVVVDDHVLKLVQANMGKPLDEFFRILIADCYGVKPEEVDVAFIHRQRELHFYPQERARIARLLGVSLEQHPRRSP